MKNSRESNNNKPPIEIIMNIPNTNKPHRNHAATFLGAAFLYILLALSIGTASAAPKSRPAPTATLLATGLEGTQGSTVGPDGALYVSESLAGRIWRVDPETGQVTTFASGLPPSLFGIGNGGVVDVAFIGKTAYALVTGVASDSGGTSVVGIYRVDGPASFTVVADIGEFNLLNPPTIPFHFDLPTGFQFAIETYRGGFLVTDANLNRVLRVTLDGEISVFIDFDNIVPTGLAVFGETVLMAEGGPDPHTPQTGKVVSFGPKSSTATEVASGVPWVLDVQFGLGRTLYALSFGTFDPNTESLNLAVPNTGALVKVNGDGTFTVVVHGLNQPTSLQFIGNKAYVVTLTGEIWTIDGLSSPPYGPAPVTGTAPDIQKSRSGAQ